MGIIEIKNLQKKFATEAEELEILQDINLNVAENTTVMISGESGCGKSTLLNIIGGLDACDGGELIVDGMDISSMNEGELSDYRKKKIGFIFQFHYLMKDFTCLENVMMPYYMAGNSKAAARKKAVELLSKVKLEHRFDHYPLQLSGGERQRAALARALVNDPSIILADEPTGNLDEQNSRIVEELLLELVESFGKTLVMVTHDPELAMRGDYCYQLKKGALELR